MNEIAKHIREIANQAGRNIIACKVTAVDGKTCDVEPLDGSAPLKKVKLNSAPDQNYGIVATPVVDSVVLIALRTETDASVLMFSEIEKYELILSDDIKLEMNKNEIIFNDNSKNSYLIDINNLKTKLNNIENDLNTLKNIFTAWVPVPMDGGAVLKTASTAWATQTLTPTQVSDINDEKIKH